MKEENKHEDLLSKELSMVSSWIDKIGVDNTAATRGAAKIKIGTALLRMLNVGQGVQECDASETKSMDNTLVNNSEEALTECYVLEDVKDKIECLLGYLKTWGSPYDRPAAELPQVISECEEWLKRITLPSPAVSPSINGYEEYVEQIDKLMEDYEGQALSNAIVSEIIEPLKTGAQGYWKALQAKHEDLRRLVKENKELKAAPAVGGMRTEHVAKFVRFLNSDYMPYAYGWVKKYGFKRPEEKDIKTTEQLYSEWEESASPAVKDDWISVEDRLPDERSGYSHSLDVNVLLKNVLHPNHPLVVSTGSYRYSCCTKKWCEYLYGERVDNGELEVIAWQPLPQPPTP